MARSLEDFAGMTRQSTKLEREVAARHDEAEKLISGLSDSEEDPTKVYIPSMLSGAIFCGHLVTDMDSIAGVSAHSCRFGVRGLRGAQFECTPTHFVSV